MFTGIVEHVGKVMSVRAGDRVTTLRIDLGPLATLDEGDSISVNGVCLTAVRVGPSTVDVEVVPETSSRTSLAGAEEGGRVNLERAMPADGRFDGHIVQGHVDGVGHVISLVEGGEGTRMRIEIPEGLDRYIVEKGSITVDGVSLTVAELGPSWFEVALIPHTLTMTTLGLRNPEDPVNLEVDVLAKYVERLLQEP
jgi:riboflavin synthase